MNRFFRYFSFVMLCGCEIETPELPALDQQSFSYEKVMQQQEQLKREIQKISEKS